MGIQGLLPLLKSVMVPIHIKDLEGCSVAVDTYSWLHKGALSCSMDLCKSQPTSKHVDYCMHRVNLLRHFGIKPILVFDGGHLPMKNEQEIKRARSRKENLARAIEHEQSGNTSAAYECYQKAVDISPTIAYELIQVLKQENISYVVAPYEADAQMTFLALSKHVDAVITEDSDLIPFGCPRIIYKMDKFGQGVEFQYSRLQNTKDLNLGGFSKQMILEMCILSGCDYLQSLPGMGLKKAHALIKKFKSHDKVIKHLKFSGIMVPPLYEDSFKRAMLTFLHQRVYDPVKEDIVHLSDLSEYIDEDLDFLGPLIPQNLAKGIATGDIDPITKLSIQGKCVKPGPVIVKTYDLKSFKSGVTTKKLDLPAQKNLLTNYFCFATLEAKRKFMAPRISPNHPNPPDKVPQIDSSEEIVDTIPARKTSMILESLSHDDLRKVQHAKHPIHPCIASHKESDSNYSLDGIEGKTRVQKKPIVVRSSYFQHKNVAEDDLKNTNTNPSNGDDDVALGNKNACSETVHVAILQASEVKPKVEKKKSTSSRFFSQNNQENMDEKSTIKRKFSISEDGAQKENLNQKYMRASAPNQGVCDFDNDDKMQERKDEEEGKFGCNISHLGKYSEIAEKSMDKFISVISSFKCNSSGTGSRASGLRAPLKDLRNTCTKKLSSIDDISKFGYNPTKPLRLPNRKP